MHHPLILNISGEKLSKSKGAESIKYLRENSVEPSQVWNWFATQFGYSGATIEKAEQLIEFAEDLALRNLPKQLFPFLPK